MNSMSNPAPRHVHPLRNAAVAVAVIASAALSQAPVSTAAASAPVKAAARSSAALSAARSRAAARPQAATTFGRSTSATPRATLAPGTPTHAVAAPLIVGPAWSSVGPTPQVSEQYLGSSPPSKFGNVSGRVTALAVDPTDATVVYAGEAGGGVWKSVNSGTTWTPLTDAQGFSNAIGAIAIDPSNHLTIYAGTGEDNGSGDAQYGRGILKSLDGGTSWTLVDSGYFATATIGGIAIDRTTATAASQHVFAATDAGLFESTDGGATWTQNTNLRANSPPISGAGGGVFQIIQDPTTATKWWASVADQGFSEWGSIAQSADSGATWTTVLTIGSNADKMLRLGLGVGTGGASGVAYVAPADKHGDLFNNQIQKTTNGGGTWTPITVPAPPGGVNYFDFGGGQGGYDNVVAIDPTNNGHVLLGGVDVLHTTDGGTTFNYVGNVYNSGFIHPDYHAIAFTGVADHAYIGNDGGVWSTANLGGTGTPSASDWTNLNTNLTTTTYYGGAALDSQTLLGGAQDNGTSGHFSVTNSPALLAFQSYQGGDGGYAAITPDAQTIYGEYPFGEMSKGSPALSGASPPEPGGFAEAGPCDFNTFTSPACNDVANSNVSFIMPFALDRLNPSRLVAGTSHVWESNSGGVPAGSGWHAISPDLTYGAACSGCDFISALTIVPGTGTIFTGSHFGRVQMTTDDGSNWTDITGSGIPDPFAVSNLFFPRDAIGDIQYNPSNANELWIAYGGIDFSTPRGRVFHTTNAAAGGATVWTDISGSLPADPARSLYVDPTTPGTVYVGTWHGVYVCTTCGAGSPMAPSWSILGSGLPQVEVSQMTPTSDGKVLAWTFGRGVWSLPLPDIQQATSWSQYTLTGNDSSTWQTMDATKLKVNMTAAANGTAVLGANADLWTSSTGFNQDIAIFVNDNGSGDQLVGWKESGGFGGTFSPNAAYLLATWPLASGHTYVFTIKWKSNKPEGGAVIWAGAGPIASAFSPTRLTVQPLSASLPVVDQVTPLADQPTLMGSDGVTWQPIDDANLSYNTGLVTSPQTDLVQANADLFTNTAGYNQDIGIFFTDNGGLDTLLAWKESGGSAGIFSPNAAFLQSSLSLVANHTYTIHLKWKTNKPGSAKIYAGAGSNPYSPTRLTVIPAGGADPLPAVITTQPTLTGNDGVTWQPLDASVGGTGLPVTVIPPSSGIAIVGGNADLWTSSAGYNQDIGIFVTDNTGAAQLIAWKESGGFAGTFSPNAAFVQDKFPVLSGHTYVFKLYWKTNRSDPGTIWAGAGPISGAYSPTSLSVSLR
jgi:hypothetical protein